MRLFPSPLEGLHPALPAWPEDVKSIPAPRRSTGASIDIFSPTNAGYAGLLPLLFGVAFRLPAAKAIAFESAAYGFLALSGCDKVFDTIDSIGKRLFLQQQGIEVPQPKTIGRVGKIDYGDISFLGAVTGIALATSARKPWSVSGWRRFVGAGVLGSAAAHITAPFVSKPFVSQQEREKVARWRTEAQAGHVAIQKFNLAVSEQQLQNSGVKIPEMKRSGGSIMIPAGTSASPSINDSRDKLGHFLNSWPNEGNAPHLVKRAYDEHQEPEPYAHTNYTWTSENQIPDL